MNNVVQNYKIGFLLLNMPEPTSKRKFNSLKLCCFRYDNVFRHKLNREDKTLFLIVNHNKRNVNLCLSYSLSKR